MTTIAVKCKCTELSIHLSNSNLIRNFNIFPFIEKGAMFCLQDLSFIVRNSILIMKHSFSKYHNHVKFCLLFIPRMLALLRTRATVAKHS